jgi:uncharacterized protein
VSGLLAWRRTDESAGHSVARLAPYADGWVAHGSEVLAGGPDVLACWFTVRLDHAWATRWVEVRALDAGGERSLALKADADGLVVDYEGFATRL